jgi:hypothetical protein
MYYGVFAFGVFMIVYCELSLGQVLWTIAYIIYNFYVLRIIRMKCV